MKPYLWLVLLTSLGSFLGFSNSAGAERVTLSIDITTMPDEPFEDAVALIKRAGAEATSLSLFWDDLEPSPGNYAPEFDWPTIANAYYPTEDLSLTLTFSVIDTNADRRRADLTDIQWDDPTLLAAFAKHIDDVLIRMPDVEIVAISVGNEVDGVLISDAEIAAYSRFLASARHVIQTHRPNVPMGAKITFASLTDNLLAWEPILSESTALMTTYYPLDPDFRVRPPSTVRADMDLLSSVAPGLPIYILEAGYPSAGCGASVDAQAEFVQNLRTETALRSDQFALVSLSWLTDLSDAEISQYVDYCGIADNCFRAYLASLGLRHQTGEFKPAFVLLIADQ